MCSEIQYPEKLHISLRKNATGLLIGETKATDLFQFGITNMGNISSL